MYPATSVGSSSTGTCTGLQCAVNRKPLRTAIGAIRCADPRSIAASRNRCSYIVCNRAGDAMPPSLELVSVPIIQERHAHRGDLSTGGSQFVNGGHGINPTRRVGGAWARVTPGVRLALPFQHPRRNHQLLNLAGSLVNLSNSRVAVSAFHRIFPAVAIPAMNLNRLVRHPRRHFTGKQFGCRRLLAEPPAAILLPRCFPYQQARP